MTLGQVSFLTIMVSDKKSITERNLENSQGHENTTCFSWKKKKPKTTTKIKQQTNKKWKQIQTSQNKK